MALGSLSSAKINKKILFFQGKALFYLFIISNIFVHHITIHGMNAFFREMDAYLAVTWVYSPDHCTIGVFIIIGGAFIIKVGGFFMPPNYLSFSSSHLLFVETQRMSSSGHPSALPSLCILNIPFL